MDVCVEYFEGNPSVRFRRRYRWVENMTLFFCFEEKALIEEKPEKKEMNFREMESSERNQLGVAFL